MNKKSFAVSIGMWARLRALAAVAIVAAGLGLAWPAQAAAGLVTRGDFHSTATGIARGYDISGHAVMVRTGSGATLVRINVGGLAANTAYPAHVHNLPCSEGGGGHYQHVVGGAVDAVNEIWPGFTTNAAGMGSGQAGHAHSARPEAQSIVIHDTDGARLACADLLP